VARFATARRATLLVLAALSGGCAGGGMAPGTSDAGVRSAAEALPAPRAIVLPDAPPLGPYSPAVVAGDLVFVSGQLPFMAGTRQLPGDDIAAQTLQALRNLDALVTAAGSDRKRVVKVTVYLADAADFAAMNATYAAFFTDHLPARTTVPGVSLPPGVRIEVDAVALRGTR
jgi:2-iminobutanoate/2-iminopropanoate deaminase